MAAYPVPSALLQLPRHDPPRPGCLCFRTRAGLTTRFQERELRQIATITNGDPIPRPLSLCIAFPQRPLLRTAADGGARGNAYLTRLYREIAMSAELFDRDRQVEQVHVLDYALRHLHADQLAEAMDVIGRHYSWAAPERTLRSVELEPASTRRADIPALVDAGFNRAVFNLDSDLDSDIPALAGLVEDLRQHGLRNIHVNLSGRLFEQPSAELDALLTQMLALRPDRLGLRRQARPPLPETGQQTGNEEAATGVQPDGFENLAQRVEAAGYVHIGLGCFTPPDNRLALADRQEELRCDLLGYTTRAESDIVGLGVGALSHIGSCLSQNPRDLPSWEDAIDHGRLPTWRGMQLDENELLRAELIQQLVCQGALDYTAIGRQYGIDFRQRFANALTRLETLAAQGLVELHPTRLHVTVRGRLALPALAACFDPHPAADGDVLRPHIARIP
ncbi:MAG: coproporphyrinogen III oxidase [Lysobacteraceae bacterium]